MKYFYIFLYTVIGCMTVLPMTVLPMIIIHIAIVDYNTHSDSELLETIIPFYKIIYNEYATEFRKHAPKK